MPLIRTLHRMVRQRTSPRMLALARVAAGLAAALASLEALRLLSRLLRPAVIRLPLVPSIPLLPSGALRIFVAVWLLAAVLFAAGWKTRIAGALLTLLSGYMLLLDQQTYSNHLYLLVLVLLLLTISDSGAACSLDAWRRGGRRDVAAWPVFLLKCQATIVYAFSALSKITGPYLSGRILTGSLRREGWLAVPLSWQSPAAMTLFAAASVGVELFIAIGLWSRRLRPLALACGAGFHLLILAVVDSSRLSLAVFALAMAASYLLFVDAELWARWKQRVHGRPLRTTEV